LAFLGCAADNFINQGLDLAVRARLIARSPFTQRPQKALDTWRRNINLLSIVYAFRP
jgi:hypothetical protein